MFIPCICRIATTHDAAASPSVAVSTATVEPGPVIAAVRAAAVASAGRLVSSKASAGFRSTAKAEANR
jgi:hypothetical protein